jgi:hypothetical protein
LTDLDPITAGGLTCKYERDTRLGGRARAQITFKGKVTGMAEDGPTVHEIEGFYYFDLQSHCLSYVTIEGTRQLRGADGKNGGQVTGRFTMTRLPRDPSPALDDNALRGLTVEPNAENTRLLFDGTIDGLGFSYPRNWHLEGSDSRQLGLVEKGGSGLLMVRDPGPPQQGVADKFMKDARDRLAKDKATIHRVVPPQQIDKTTSKFSIDATIGGQKKALDYYVIQQPAGTVTVTATLLPRDLPHVAQEVERIARSVQITATR